MAGRPARMNRHQLVLQRNKGLACPRIALPAASSEQLAINPAGFVSLGGYYVETPEIRHTRSQANIRAPPRHVGRYRDTARLTGMSYNLSLFLVLAGVQHTVGQRCIS